MSLLSESKRFNDFTSEEKRQIFNVFTQSYVKATGSSWDEKKFYSRAGEWIFFGDPSGFVTVRPQKSGFYKLTGVAGNPKSILRSLQELNSTNYPIWGMLTKELANILVKRYGFRMPNRLEGFVIGKLITKNVFGNVEYIRNPDGSLTFKYADVGETTKVFVGNREYYKKIRRDALKRVFSPKQAVSENVITEKRAIEHYFEDSFKLVSEYIKRYGYEHTYVSFRQTTNTTFINRSNKYNTPTGFYMYPLKNYQEKIAQSTDMQSFMKAFPYTPESKFAFLFTIINTDNILTSLNINIEKIRAYVNKIKELYGEKKPAIKTLCDLYFTDESFKPRGGSDYQYKNEFQKFWLFLYEIAYELRANNKEYNSDRDSSNYKEYPSTITIIADDIGLNGFIDDGCTSTIHGGEPCQGVLLSNVRETLGNLKIVPIYQKYDAPLNIDNPNAPTVDPSEYKNKYEKYLKGKLNAKEVYIVDNNYQLAIKNRLPFVIIANSYIPYYINRDGNLSVSGLDTTKILSNDPYEDTYDDTLKQKRTAYINSLLNTKYDEVRPFGKYGGDVAFAVHDNGSYAFINKEGKPDITGVDILKIGDGKTRAVYFNQLLGKEIFDQVSSFNDYGGEIALAHPLSGGQSYFIDKMGNPDIINVDVTKVSDSNTRAIIINQKLGKKYYYSIGAYNKYGQGIAVAVKNNGDKVFINIEGKPSIANVNINSISEGDLRATYVNQKLRKKIFSFVGNYDKFGAGIALGRYIDGSLKFINKLGQPDLEHVDFDAINDTDTRALYINQKNGTDFKSVGIFDKIGDDVAPAVRDDGTIEFINREGKPSMGNVDINRIDDSHVRAQFINKLLGTNYTHVTKFDEFGSDIALAGNRDTNTHEFINREGKPDVSTVDLNKIGDKTTRAVYFNQKYGTHYDGVYDFGTYGNDVALAYNNKIGKVFINREGMPDTSGIEEKYLDEPSVHATYYNQKFGTHYVEIGPFGVYGKDIAIASDDNDNRMFINRKGKKSTIGVNVDELTDSLRVIYYNQKFKTKYKTISDFGQYGENIAVARDKNNKNVFINREGKPDISGVDPNSIKNMNSNIKAAYFNTINGTNFTDIYESLTNNQTNVLFGSLPSGGYAFINNKGKPTIKIKNLQMLKDQYGENTVNDIIKNTKKILTGELKENYSILHSIINEEVMNYFQ